MAARNYGLAISTFYQPSTLQLPPSPTKLAEMPRACVVVQPENVLLFV